MNQSNDHQHVRRRTKIIATLGPACDDIEVMRAIVRAGVNVVRLNFSHGTQQEQKKRIDLVRKVAKEQNRIVGILADLQGPKIRVANFVDGRIELEVGQPFVLDAGLDDDMGTSQSVGIDYKELPQDVSAGDTLLLDDGRINLTVDRIEGKKIFTTVVVGGKLSNHKGINRLGGGLSAAALTPKDKADLTYALAQNVDYLAISFPRSADDINEARALVEAEENKAFIIAKIERAEAIPDIDDIIEASDGVMVARGDLAVEIGDAEVPLAQKEIIHRARALDKPVIIATQMMESMLHSTVPTRAEVSDVANAVIDNVDAVMLSEETAVGDNPPLVIETMARVCMSSEQQPRYQISGHRMDCQFNRVDEAIAMATMYTANHLHIKAVIALTESGATPLMMSRIRTAMPIYALSRYKKTLGRMSLYRGVYPVEFDVTQCAHAEVNKKSIDILDKMGVIDHGDRVILTKGDYMGVGGGSNAMKILVVGKVS